MTEDKLAGASTGSASADLNNHFLKSSSNFLEIWPVAERVDVTGLINYLCTRAPAPFITLSTSFKEAMVVSPGVVMAKAPWAAP